MTQVAVITSDTYHEKGAFMNVEGMLRSYKRKKGKVEVIQLRIDGYQEALDHPDGWEEIVLTPCIEPGMPRSQNVSRTSSVERTVANKEEAVALIKEWIREDKSRMGPLKIEVAQIESAVNSLTMQEKKVVEWKYFENMFWREIEFLYNDTFRQENRVTTEGLRKINKKALDQLEDILKEIRLRRVSRKPEKYPKST